MKPYPACCMHCENNPFAPAHTDRQQYSDLSQCNNESQEEGWWLHYYVVEGFSTGPLIEEVAENSIDSKLQIKCNLESHHPVVTNRAKFPICWGSVDFLLATEMAS